MAEDNINNNSNQSNNTGENNDGFDIDSETLPVIEIKDEFIEYFEDEEYLDDDNDAINESAVNRVRIRNVSEINGTVDGKDQSDDNINITVVRILEKKRKYTMHNKVLSSEEEYKFNVTFIQAIEQCECLWNPSCTENHQRSLKIYRWKELGYQFDLTGREAYHKFLKLRRAYSEEDAKVATTNQSSTWPYMKHLKFLDITRDSVTQRINFNSSMEADIEDVEYSLSKIMRPSTPIAPTDRVQNHATMEEQTNKNTMNTNRNLNGVIPISISQHKGNEISGNGRMENPTQKANITMPLYYSTEGVAKQHAAHPSPSLKLTQLGNGKVIPLKSAFPIRPPQNFISHQDKRVPNITNKTNKGLLQTIENIPLERSTMEKSRNELMLSSLRASTIDLNHNSSSTGKNITSNVQVTDNDSQEQLQKSKKSYSHKRSRKSSRHRDRNEDMLTDMPTAKISTAMSTAKISTAMSTAKTSTAMSTAKISTAMSTANMPTAMSTAKLTTAMAAAKLSMALATAMPTAKISTAMSTAKISTAMSTANISTVMSSAKISTAMSTAKISTAISTANISTVMSTAKISTAMSTANMSTAMPTANMSTAMPTANMSTAMPTANMSTAMPIANMWTAMSTAINSTVVSAAIKSAAMSAAPMLTPTTSTPTLMNLSNNFRSTHEDVLEFIQRTFQHLKPEAAKSFEKDLMMLAVEFRYNK